MSTTVVPPAVGFIGLGDQEPPMATAIAWAPSDACPDYSDVS
jgi:hypothetical protein